MCNKTKNKFKKIKYDVGKLPLSIIYYKLESLSSVFCKNFYYFIAINILKNT
nr:MAG TPA: hypothetical protein [Caudoviricetes sp.]